MDDIMSLLNLSSRKTNVRIPRKCPRCFGRGFIELRFPNETRRPYGEIVRCPECNGTGEHD